MSASSTLRIALLGAGDIGRSAHLPALTSAPDAELVAIAEPDPGKRARVARAAPGVRVVADHRELLADPSIEAVTLATPPWITWQLAIDALAAGKWVLAEKPLAPSLAQAERLLGAEGAATRLQVGFTYRHHPAIERIRDVVRAGALGRPLLIRMSLFDEAADPDGAPEHFERISRTLEHGMPVIHEGAHFCDWLNLILGDFPAEVGGWAVATDPEFAAPNLNSAWARYADGTLATLETGWLLPRLPASHITFSGPLGHVALDPATFALRIATAAGTEELALDQDRVPVCFGIQLRRFVAAWAEGRAPEPGVEAARQSMRFTEALAAALRPTLSEARR